MEISFRNSEWFLDWQLKRSVRGTWLIHSRSRSKNLRVTCCFESVVSRSFSLGKRTNSLPIIFYLPCNICNRAQKRKFQLPDHHGKSFTRINISFVIVITRVQGSRVATFTFTRNSSYSYLTTNKMPFPRDGIIHVKVLQFGWREDSRDRIYIETSILHATIVDNGLVTELKTYGATSSDQNYEVTFSHQTQATRICY